MKRIGWLSLLSLLLSGCGHGIVTDEDSPRSRLLPGSVLVLHQALTVPPGHTRVFLQDGKVRDKLKLDMYYPHCNFELRTLSDAPQTIRPDRFVITQVSWNEETVVDAATNPGRLKRVSDSGDTYAGPITRLLHHRLHSESQTTVMRLTCHGGFDDPWRASFPSVNQIRKVLGEVARVDLP